MFKYEQAGPDGAKVMKNLALGWPWFAPLGMSIMIIAGITLQSGKIAETDPDAQIGKT